LGPIPVKRVDAGRVAATGHVLVVPPPFRSELQKVPADYFIEIRLDAVGIARSRAHGAGAHVLIAFDLNIRELIGRELSDQLRRDPRWLRVIALPKSASARLFPSVYSGAQIEGHGRRYRGRPVKHDVPAIAQQRRIAGRLRGAGQPENYCPEF